MSTTSEAPKAKKGNIFQRMFAKYAKKGSAYFARFTWWYGIGNMALCIGIYAAANSREWNSNV
jgi:hypothetical protein